MSSDQQSSLDQVREILFGVQAKEISAKFGEVDHHFQQYRDDVQRRFEGLEWGIRQELAKTAERITAEATQRQTDLESHAERLAEVSRDLQAKFAQLDQQIKATESALREEMDARLRQLSHDLTLRCDQIVRDFHQRSDSLDKRKVDRQSLRDLLHSLADQMSDES
ncbi:MAG: hypothetical protein R3C28_26795 [Pirellulaceae bacterium]